ncbi:MAG: ABC transporter ATP-binding protein/permease [Alphaproteobacteria bacterium]|nr:ABC transporter ATP-binding protein/permease [Alphaproteobacteria bacterium]
MANPNPALPAPAAKLRPGFFRDLWRLTKPYWVSEQRWSALALLAVILGLAVFLVYFNVQFNAWYGRFYNALQEYDLDAFWSEMRFFAILATINIVVAVLQIYLRLMLRIRWRKWLTERYLSDWMRGHAYYALQMRGAVTDNPDQRIADDVDQYIAQTLSLTLGALDAIMNLVSFSVILWSLSAAFVYPPIFGMGGEDGWSFPGSLLWIGLVWAVLGTILIHFIGRPLVGLNYQQQKLEADFRYALIRARENVEGIALYGGEADEKRTFSNRFTRVVGNFWEIIVRQVKIVAFQSGFAQIGLIFPFLLAAFSYFNVRTIQLGALMQTIQAFGQVQSAMTWIIDAYISLAGWRATVDRLTTFSEALDAAHAFDAAPKGIAVAAAGENRLHIRRVELKKPEGAPMSRSIDATVGAGESVLVKGASGAGKTTLFRALSGLWPFGAGEIELPAQGKVLFLPQRPYLPLGTLRLVVSYPAPPEGYSDAEIAETLRAVGLPQLVDSLDDDRMWGQVLSQGEQQRVAFARALLYKPDWLFMDEATAALDEKSESELYRLLKAQLPKTAVVSIGHRASLTEFHGRTIEVVPALQPAAAE